MRARWIALTLMLVCACDSCSEAPPGDDDLEEEVALPSPPALPELPPAEPGALVDVTITYSEWGRRENVSLRRDRCVHTNARVGISDGTDDFARYETTSCTTCLSAEDDPLLDAIRELHEGAMPSEPREWLRVDLGEGPPAPFADSRLIATLSFAREGEDDGRALTREPDVDLPDLLTRLRARVHEHIDPSRCVDWED